MEWNYSEQETRNFISMVWIEQTETTDKIVALTNSTQGSPMREFLAKIPFHIAVLLSLTLGLAPFVPEPHIWEKLKMLADGTLSRPIDIFDLLMHGIPWVILILKIALGQFRQPA